MTETPHEAALRVQEASVEHARHVETVDQLLEMGEKLDAALTLLAALANRFGVVTP